MAKTLLTTHADSIFIVCRDTYHNRNSRLVGFAKTTEKWGIYYDKIFSITDYHVSIGTHIEWDEKGHPHIDDRIWDSTKADYCRKNKIFLAIDDSPIYSEYFTTPYLHFKIK